MKKVTICVDILVDDDFDNSSYLEKRAEHAIDSAGYNVLDTYTLKQ